MTTVFWLYIRGGVQVISRRKLRCFSLFDLKGGGGVIHVPFEFRAAKRLALILPDKVLGVGKSEHTGQHFRADFPSGLRQLGK